MLPAEIAQLEYSSGWIEQQILWFDIAVANPFVVDVGETAHQLVHVQLCERRRKRNRRV